MLTLPPQVNTALQLLKENGYEGYIVGGSVRNYLHGIPDITDWDITTSALPEQTKAVFSDYHVVETGIKHGTVTVFIDHIPMEITTYRVDGVYSDNRRPDSIHFTASLEEDLSRRDFTMNALAYAPSTGVVDFFGGKDDLKNNLIRCVGDPDTRFKEDALRILRALRFAAVLGMDIEEKTSDALHRNKLLLHNIAFERIHAELDKLICGKDAVKIMDRYRDIIAIIIPEIADMFDFLQHNPYHDKDVWHHTLAVVENIPAQPVLRWSALFHDIGKPSCFFLSPDGIGHFYGHGEKSEDLTRSILSRLKFDNDSRHRILTLVRHHDTPITPERRPIKKMLNRFGEPVVRDLLLLHRADTLGQSPKSLPRLQLYDKACTIIDDILSAEECFSLKDLRINGSDLIGIGYFGPQIGDILKKCLDAVIDSDCTNEKEALMTYVTKHFPL